MRAALMVLAALATLTLPATPARSAAWNLFQTVEFRADSLAALPQWRRVLRGVAAERADYRACADDAGACGTRALLAWRAMLKGQAGRDELEQVRAVNRFANTWGYRSDRENYGAADHWATPLEFLHRSGDCEDYAIVKYVSLRELGFAPERLRLVVVQDVLRDTAHAVLAVALDDGVHILDNLTNAVLPQRRVSHYVPYYSVNETARWAHVPPLGIRLAGRAPADINPSAGAAPR